MKRSHSISIYVFYAVYFVSLGITSFNPKYLGELGLNDAQIGMIMSIPGVIGIFFQSVWGILSDRVRLKRNILFFACLLGGISYFCTGFTSAFWPLILGMTAVTIMLLPITPVTSTIAMEHCEKTGLSFGPMRLCGTLGYQIGALVIGFILASSLKGIFQIIGVMLLVCAGISFFLPPVQGHQHGRAHVSIFKLLKEKRLFLLLLMSFVACSTSGFYMAFFTKHLGDLGIDNSITGIITVISVFFELPFLLLAKHLYKKMSIWHWVLLGFVLNGVRWIALGLSKDVAWIIVANVPAVSIMASFEFFPALYINEITAKELKGSAQNLLSLSTFGFTKLTGSLLGGFLSNAFGIPTVFVGCGVLLLLMAAIFVLPCRKMILAERQRESVPL